jgi:predicted lipoprotein with Yx(FWY)xxD motif
MNVKYVASAGLTVLVAGIAAIIIALNGGSATARPSHTVAAGSSISIRTTSLGQTLVDAHGRTLYLFKGDTRDVSRLSQAGLSVWPRFLAAGAVKAGKGVQAARLGMITSPRGIRQVTYNGDPLYYYVGDSKPGSTHGQGLNEFGALWYVLGPSGEAITRAAGTANTPTSTQSNSGY